MLRRRFVRRGRCESGRKMRIPNPSHGLDARLGPSAVSLAAGSGVATGDPLLFIVSVPVELADSALAVNDGESSYCPPTSRAIDADSPVAVRTPGLIAAADNAFSDELVPFARNEITEDVATLGCSSAKMASLLLDRGANFSGHDDWGPPRITLRGRDGKFGRGGGGIEALIDVIELDRREGNIRRIEGCPVEHVHRVLFGERPSHEPPTTLHWAAAGVSHTIRTSDPADASTCASFYCGT
ncbi:hypothetical protein ACHAWF_017213 [Thalassiosira exigua]